MPCFLSAGRLEEAIICCCRIQFITSCSPVAVVPSGTDVLTSILNVRHHCAAV